MPNLLVVAYVDGASRGNPGPAGVGVVLCDGRGEVLKELSQYIGITTNNQAEYRALLLALQEARALGASSVRVVTDSELLVKQLRGEYRVKEEHLRSLWEQVRRATEDLVKFEVLHVPRGANVRADHLANSAIEEAGRG